MLRRRCDVPTVQCLCDPTTSIRGVVVVLRGLAQRESFKIRKRVSSNELSNLFTILCKRCWPPAYESWPIFNVSWRTLTAGLNNEPERFVYLSAANYQILLPGHDQQIATEATALAPVRWAGNLRPAVSATGSTGQLTKVGGRPELPFSLQRARRCTTDYLGWMEIFFLATTSTTAARSATSARHPLSRDDLTDVVPRSASSWRRTSIVRAPGRRSLRRSRTAAGAGPDGGPGISASRSGNSAGVT